MIKKRHYYNESSWSMLLQGIICRKTGFPWVGLIASIQRSHLRLTTGYPCHKRVTRFKKPNTASLSLSLSLCFSSFHWKARNRSRTSVWLLWFLLVIFLIIPHQIDLFTFISFFYHILIIKLLLQTVFFFHLCGDTVYLFFGHLLNNFSSPSLSLS